LSDAKFFWEQDLKIPLDEQAKKLSQITFHEKLGTVADKVERVAKLARWLVEEDIVKGASADHAERAARLCKADLVTGMVGEFPELQGIMGGYYARAQGEADAVADAVRDHYKPVGQGDDVPTAPVTVAVSLADKLDTLAAFFLIQEKPTGSKDPFALRRASLGVLQIILANEIRINLASAFDELWQPVAQSIGDAQRRRQEIAATALQDVGGGGGTMFFGAFAQGMQLREGFAEQHDQNSFVLLDFFADRLKVQQREAGVRHDLIDAVFALGGEDDLVRMLARVKALQAFVGTDEGANLLAGYKRAANILKSSPSGEGNHAQHGGGARAESRDGEGGATPDVPLHHPSDGPPPRAGEELALLTALNTAEPLAISAIEAERFEDAMAAMASLRAPIDAFFDGVMVNDPDPEKRAFRLGLLARFRDAVHRVADFSRIEG
jgi:glycyl-tRNA synthetase beta chain